MVWEDHARLHTLPSKQRAHNSLDVCPPRPQNLEGELRVAGMNLLSGTTWKGGKLRIGEAKPDFRERYEIHICGIRSLISAPIGLNARTRQVTDQLKSVVWKETSRASTLRICPLSLLRMSLHDLVGALLQWAGSFIPYECGQRSLFHLHL